MTRTTIAFTEETWADLTAALGATVETAGVILAGRAAVGTDVTFMARSVAWIPAQFYERRRRDGLAIDSGGYVPILKRASDEGLVAIFFHTHPGNFPKPSLADDAVDTELRSLFPIRTGQGEYVSLVLGGTSASPTFTGRVCTADAVPRPVERIRTVGRRLRILFPAGRNANDMDDVFDRQLRAFGREGQRLLAELHVGVVGAGGTGSAVCEQLLRLGVGALTVIDDDVITPTNLTRVYGSSMSDVGRAKVAVVAANAARIGLGTQVCAIEARVTERAVAQELRDCDIIFGCTDDHAGRAILARLAYWYLLPLIDMGFLVDSAGGRVRGLFGRISTVLPGTPCLLCRGRIDPGMARNDTLPPKERMRLAAEGYTPGLGEPDPSVVVYTTLVASLAVNEMLERLIGYGPTPAPSELLVRLHDRELRSVSVSAQDGHYCLDRNMWARGDTDPFLGQLWA